MKRANQNFFAAHPVDHGQISIYEGAVLEDDDPIVSAYPSLFEAIEEEKPKRGRPRKAA